MDARLLAIAGMFAAVSLAQGIEPGASNPSSVSTAVAPAAPGVERVVYTKSFPGSDPDWVSISVDRSGMVVYKEAPDDDPDTFQLEPMFTDRIFDLSVKLDHFKKNVESGLKVANMGAKTFRWESGSDAGQLTFNYSTDPSAQTLWTCFESLTSSERAYLILKREVRHDKLGVNDALIAIADLWNDQKLVGTSQFLPLFDRVAGDDSYIHLARERAAELGETIRNWGK